MDREEIYEDIEIEIRDLSDDELIRAKRYIENGCPETWDMED